MSKEVKMTLPKIDVDSELVKDFEEVARKKGYTMPQLRRRAYALYVNSEREKAGLKPKHYAIAK